MTRRHWITIYELATGAVLYSAEARAGEEDALCLPGQGWKLGLIDADEERINPATGRRVKLQPIKPKVSGNRLTGLPEGTEAIVAGRKVAVTGGTLTVAVDHPQTVGVRLLHPLYRNPEPIELACVPEPAPEAAAVRVARDPARLRAAAYPATGEQLGALVKAVKALLAGEEPPADALAVIAEVDAVKARLPVAKSGG